MNIIQIAIIAVAATFLAATDSQAKYCDDETDLVYYGYRYYNPSGGRWLSRDPIEERGGLNLYGMLDNDSVNYIDQLGLSISDWWRSCTTCKCKDVTVTYSPGGNSYGIGRIKKFMSNPIWGSDVHVHWNVTGNSWLCKYYQDEKGTTLTLSDGSKNKPQTVTGTDGHKASQDYTDYSGFTIHVPGSYTMVVNWHVTFRCVSSDGTTVSRTDQANVQASFTEQ